MYSSGATAPQLQAVIDDESVPYSIIISTLLQGRGIFSVHANAILREAPVTAVSRCISTAIAGTPRRIISGNSRGGSSRGSRSEGSPSAFPTAYNTTTYRIPHTIWINELL